VTKIVLAVLVAVLSLTGSAFAQTPSSYSTESQYFWAKAEYLLWWTKDAPQPLPLVTYGPLTSAHDGIVMGGKDVDFGPRNGGRGEFGFWFTPDHMWGAEIGGFWLPKVTDNRSVASPGTVGSPHLVVPFFDTNRNNLSFTDLSLPGAFAGIAGRQMSSLLWGLDTNLVIGIVKPGPWTLDLLTGFRFMRLEEGLSFRTDSPDLPGGSTSVFTTTDSFNARNDFYGGQFGIRARFGEGRWFGEAFTKVALGAMRQYVDINGSFVTNLFNPHGLQAFPGGIFAQPTNMGRHHRDVFAVIPEVGLNMGFRVTDWMSLVLGYNFLYVSNVARPGNQMDQAINPSQAPSISLSQNQTLHGAARPALPQVKGSDFWAHGLTAGIAFNF
jgi:hypothetical protein